ncbi:DUF6286 domain-containing protein [Streptomyces sp. C10-9-1]|uniref:DUF6286 domain-containing Asp23/Gls24 family envelope stress response protein n=1 Tax=Streptomyces sp. C10-9-1 TaxID=1859285 RepID=UPI0021112749|nr:DUF6286 domain-containing protein [Streptomyces sp. C10-9-1]MCQ6552808.1 DUF6286 domain-containing protein [Streptomyces sp. C10-9-1]
MSSPAERGTTTVSDTAIRRITERAAVEALSLTASGTAKRSAAAHVGRSGHSIRVSLRYPVPLSDAVRRVQEHVLARTRELTGHEIGRPHITVSTLSPSPAVGLLPEQVGGGGPVAKAAFGSGTPLRWWSQRRLPSALLAMSAALAAGLLVLHVFGVPIGGSAGSQGRRWALSRLGGPAVTAVAGAVAALGLSMITLALAPGLRRLHTLTSTARLQAAVDRRALEALVQDAVQRVPGVSAVRVRLRRRRMTVRAELVFGSRAAALDTARRQTVTALAGCRLHRTPRLSLSARLSPDWVPEPAAVSARERQVVDPLRT